MPTYGPQMQRKRKRKGEDDGEEYVPPGLEQEDYDYEQQELAAVLEEDAPGKYTKVSSAAYNSMVHALISWHKT